MPEEMMFCGRGSLKDVNKDELSGGGKTPGKEKKAPEVAKAKKKPAAGKKENPYASRGLDKFSTVLAELESWREKVLRRVYGDDRVMVRFVQSGAKGWVPIVVKFSPEEQAADAAKGDSKKKCKPPAVSSAPTQPSTPRTESASPREDVVKHAAAAKAPAKKKAAGAERWSWGKKVTRPSHYWPFVAVLLLVSLVVFGRVFAICCTSVWWYLVPILRGSNGGEKGQGMMRRSMGKIDLSKKASDKKISEKRTWASLPPSHGKSSSGAHEVISPRSHAQVKKG